MITYDSWKALLTFVYNNEHSLFYKEHFTKNNFNPETDFSTLDDIIKIPLLTKKDLLSVPSENLCFVPQSEICSLSTTSGTTNGANLITFQSPSELTSNATALEHDDYGIDMLLFSPIRAGALLYYYNQRKQVTLLGDIHNLPMSCSLAAQSNVRTITTTPTMAIILKKYIAAQPALLKSLTYLRLGGEVISQSKKEYLRELYPNLEIFTVYSSSELGRFASQCSHLSKNDEESLYHPNTTTHHLEITEDELVVTDFSNKATPLIRYKTGDLARFTEEPCSCGIPGPLISFAGRSDRDSVRAGGFEIRRDMIEKPILALQDVIHTDYEVHVHEKYIGGKPFLRLVINLALRDGVDDAESTREHILQTFINKLRLSTTTSFKNMIAAGLFANPEIVFVTFPSKVKATENIILH